MNNTAGNDRTYKDLSKKLRKTSENLKKTYDKLATELRNAEKSFEN